MMLKDEIAKWENLLSCKRLVELQNGGRETSCKTEPRNPFERDCDRITYSYPFRRLQDKTQVIPMPVIDFVHTRLTHTLEVNTVGRSLGRLLEHHLLQRKVISQDKCGDIAAIVSAACLAHDIGNPPFGHSGESSISEFFRFGEGKRHLAEQYGDEYASENDTDGKHVIFDYKDSVSRMKCSDLKNFEGNANGFRILTKLDGAGLNLTAATLGAFTKYPRTSYVVGDTWNQSWASDRVSQKKYGFFYSEIDQFRLIADELGLIKLKDEDGTLAYTRHPLAFLMEAADDICYRIIDLEDGHRIDRIPFSEAEEILLKIASKDERYLEPQYKSFENEKLKISYLRSKCINYLVFQCFDVFKNNYQGILDGDFDKDLLPNINDSDSYKATVALRDLVRKYIYKWEEVLQLEVTGFEVLSGLIKEYVDASNLCIDCPESTRSKRAIKIYDLLPNQYCHIIDTEEKYLRYLKVVDYASGMSDSYALNLYRKIKGIYS